MQYNTGKKYDLNEEYGFPSQDQSSQGSSGYNLGSPSDSGAGDSPAGGAAAGAATGNPYVMGAGIAANFITAYMKKKQEQFEQQRQMQSNAQQNYANQQDQAFNSLQNGWARALT